jgi:hypothetical protein
MLKPELLARRALNLEELAKSLTVAGLVVSMLIYCRYIWYRRTREFDMNEAAKSVYCKTCGECNEIDLSPVRQAGEKKLFLLAYLASDQDASDQDYAAFRLHYLYCEPEKADKEAALYLLKIDDASQADAFILTQLSVDCEYRARIVNCLVEQAKEKKAKTT